MADYNDLYPQLPNNDQTQKGESTINFRLQKSSEVFAKISKRKIRHYEEVRKKYNRARGICAKISVSGGFVSVLLSASGLGNFSHWGWCYSWYTFGCSWWIFLEFFSIGFWNCIQKIFPAKLVNTSKQLQSQNLN